jgi:hypothetical protein
MYTTDEWGSGKKKKKRRRRRRENMDGMGWDEDGSGTEKGREVGCRPKRASEPRLTS